jgi:O-antigen/teichoic acid export membrane protein
VGAFYMSPLLVHGLGNQRYGIWALVESVLAYLSILDFGIGAAVVRYIARFHEVHDENEVNRLFSTSIVLFALAGLVALAVTISLAFLWSNPLGVPAELVSDTQWLLVALGLNLAIGLPLNVYAAALDGLGDFPTKTAIRTFFLTVRYALFMLAIQGDGAVPKIATIVLLCGVLECAVVGVFAHLRLPGLRFAPRFVDRSTVRRIASYSGHAFLVMVASRVSFQTDAIVIGAFLAPEAITFFMIGAKLVSYAKDGIRSLTTVLTPSISALESRGDTAGIHRILITGTRYVLYLVLPIELGFIILGEPFISIWMGPEYASECFTTLWVLAVPLALTMSQSVSARILFGTGRLGWFSGATVLEAITNLILSVALVRPFGIVGVAIGTAVPNIVLNLALAQHICRCTKVRIATYGLHAWLPPLLVALIPTAVWVVTRVYWGPPGEWMSFAFVLATGLAPYALSVCVLELQMRSWRASKVERSVSLNQMSSVA